MITIILASPPTKTLFQKQHVFLPQQFLYSPNLQELRVVAAVEEIDYSDGLRQNLDILLSKFAIDDEQMPPGPGC